MSTFLSPPELIEAQTALAKLTELSIIAWSGYPQAERQWLAIAFMMARFDLDRRINISTKTSPTSSLSSPPEATADKHHYHSKS